MIEKTISVKINTSDEKVPVYTVVAVRRETATTLGEKVDPIPKETVLYQGTSRVAAHDAKNAAEKAMYA